VSHSGALSMAIRRRPAYEPELHTVGCKARAAEREPFCSHPGRDRLSNPAKEFVEAVAADSPTPGGGSVSALAGALAAALGEMVCGITLKKKSMVAHHPAVQEASHHLAQLRQRLMEAVDHDAASYEAVMAAFKLPKQTETEQAARASAIEEASKHAATVPLETAKVVVEVARIVASLRGITAPQAASDLAVALSMAEAAHRGAIENVRANLPSIKDAEWVRQIEERIKKLEAES